MSFKTKDETKHEKFRRLAVKRTQNVLESLRILGNLANMQNYDYSEEEVDKIFKAILDNVKDKKHKFLFNLQRKKKFKF